MNKWRFPEESLQYSTYQELKKSINDSTFTPQSPKGEVRAQGCPMATDRQALGVRGQVGKRKFMINITLV